MKNYAKFVLIFGIFMFAGILLFVILSGDKAGDLSVSNEKMLILNDIVKDAEEKPDSPDRLGERDYGVDFIVLDNNEKEVYNWNQLHSVLPDALNSPSEQIMTRSL